MKMIIEEEEEEKRGGGGGGISEEDISKVLKRYSVNTILTLLQEVANYCDSHFDSHCDSDSDSDSDSLSSFDWNFLAANTSTPLSDPSDYHSLWRLLAPDTDLLLHAADPDHLSASASASAYVKLHIASSSLKDDPYTNTIEAPLIIQHSDKYFTVPVFVPKQHSFPSLELDANSSSSSSLASASRRKRKPWTSSEDAELIAAVHKFGEGNWSNILKQDFKGDRSATQLSQRWGIIRKRRANSNVCLSSSSLPQLSEVQLAARKAISAALDFPVGNLRSLSSIATAGSNSDNIEVAAQTQYQTQQATATTTSSRLVTLCSSSTKTQLPSTKRCMSPNSMVKATAVAAGARIATPEDAASLLKAAQANNAVHIMPGAAASLIKSCATPPPISTTHYKNVHFLSPKESKPLSAKPIVQSMTMNATTDLPSKQDAKTANFPTKQVVQEDNPTTACEMQVDEDQTADGSNETTNQESIVNYQSTLLHRKQVAGKDLESENGNTRTIRDLVNNS